MLPGVCTHTYIRNDILGAQSLSNSDGAKFVDDQNLNEQELDSLIVSLELHADVATTSLVLGNIRFDG